jgi:hypothetical protein
MATGEMLPSYVGYWHHGEIVIQTELEYLQEKIKHNEKI